MATCPNVCKLHMYIQISETLRPVPGLPKIHHVEAKHAIGTLPPELSKMVHYKHYCKRCLLIRSVLNIAISALPTGGKLPLLRQEIIVEHC